MPKLMIGLLASAVLIGFSMAPALAAGGCGGYSTQSVEAPNPQQTAEVEQISQPQIKAPSQSQ